MPTLRSHTHLQATQANAQTKACKRVCLPNRTKTVLTRHDSPLTERRAATNTGLAKVAVQCSADTFVVNQNWFSASTFVVKIATFAKPETVSGNFK